MRTTFQFSKLSVLIAFVVCAAGLSSCKKTSLPTDTPSGNAHLLVVNGSPSSAAVNFYWTGNKFNAVPLVYGNTTGYRTITSGIRDVQIKANLTNKLLAVNTIKLKQDSSYSFFIYEANNTVATVVAQDDLSSPSFGNAKIKLVNLTLGLSSADLYISNGPALVSGVSFGSIGTYNELKAGIYNLELRLHGSSTILLTIPNVRLDNAKIYTLWSGGTAGGNTTANVSAQIINQ